MTTAVLMPVDRVRMRKDDRRSAIFDEASLIMGERGYRGFSLNDLAKRCGLTTAGLLHHFPSKEALLVALLEERDRRDQEAIVAEVGLQRGPALSRDQVLQVLRAIVAHNSTRPSQVRLYALLRTEALGQDHPAKAYFRRREDNVIDLIGQMVAPHVEDGPATARQISAMMFGLEAHWLRTDCDFDLVKEWDKAAARLLP